MATNEPKKPAKKKARKPLGQNINWSDKQLADLADISPADLLKAQALWEENAPKQVKDLLKAEVEENEKK